MKSKVGLGIVAVVLLVAALAYAAWVANGNAVCTATGAQDYVWMTDDGLGGAAMVWQDNRTGGADIYAQEIDAYGNNVWSTANGVALCTATGSQLNPRVIHNGVGYLHFAWQDYRSGTADIYIASTDRLGNIFTPANGLALCTAAGAQDSPSLALYSPTAQVFAAWGDSRAGNGDIYFASFSQFNGITTPADGAPVCTLPSSQSGAVVASRLPGHSVVAWSDLRNGNSDIYAQGMGFTGAAQWAANGVAVCTATGYQSNAMIIDDGNYGVIIAWVDFRAGTFTQAIYAQRLDASGNPLWAANGVLIAQSTDLIILPRMIPDGTGGAVIAWEDDRNSGTTGPDIYAQRISAGGVVQWGVNGLVVCNASFAQNSVDLALGAFGNTVITWQDFRSLGPTDVYAQAVDPSGATQWTANGIQICTANGNQFGPRIVGDGTGIGGCIIGWEDRRSGNPDIYAQRVQGYSGVIGHPEPTIVSVTDVPSDNGGFVTVQWQPGEPAQLNFFQVYRRVSFFDPWDFVAQGGGDGSTTYNTVVPTTADGVANYFLVATWAFNGGEYNSNEAWGMSESNATPIGDTPGMPTALALRPNSPNPFSATTQLHVGLPREADVHLEVYDVAGRRVFAREVGRMGAGWRDIAFDGHGDNGQPLASGVYFYRVTAGRETMTRKMVIGR